MGYDYIRLRYHLFYPSYFNPVSFDHGLMPGDKQDENLATIRMRKMTPAA
jgi:hypothetical protein